MKPTECNDCGGELKKFEERRGSWWGPSRPVWICVDCNKRHYLFKVIKGRG